MDIIKTELLEIKENTVTKGDPKSNMQGNFSIEDMIPDDKMVSPFLMQDTSKEHLSDYKTQNRRGWTKSLYHQE